MVQVVDPDTVRVGVPEHWHYIKFNLFLEFHHIESALRGAFTNPLDGEEAYPIDAQLDDVGEVAAIFEDWQQDYRESVGLG